MNTRCDTPGSRRSTLARPSAGAAVALAGLIAVSGAAPSALQAQEPPPEERRGAEACPCPDARFFQWHPGGGAEWPGGLRFEAPTFEGHDMDRWFERFRFQPDTAEGRGAMLRAPLFEMLGLRPGTGRYGLRLHDLDAELGRYFGRTGGALVLEVADDAALDLRAGDVIVAIDAREVEDAAHAARILQSYQPGEPLSIEVWREERSVRIDGTAP